MINRITLRYRKKFWNTQLMSMIIFYVFLAAESEFNIRFSPSRLDFSVQEVEIFHFYRKLKKYFLARVDYHYVWYVC